MFSEEVLEKQLEQYIQEEDDLKSKSVEHNKTKSDKSSRKKEKVKHVEKSMFPKLYLI